MDFKTLFFPALLTPLLLCAPLPAAQQMASYAEAKPHIGADGCIFFAYADGWDAHSKQRCEALMADPAILKAARKAILIPLPIPEYADEARKQRQTELCGGLQVPGAPSYPALIFFNHRGQHYATLSGSEVTRGKPAELAALLSRRLAGGRERNRLLAEAEKAQGPARAALLFKAYQIDGLTWGGRDITQQIARLDPKDESGAVRARNFNAYGFAKALDEKELGQALAEVERMLEDKAYTDRQKQLICAAAIGTLRRRGNHEEAQKIRRYAELMAKYAPDTPEGKAAGYVLREWIPALRYSDGWTPAALPIGTTPVELVGPLPIREAGTYTVTFTYSRGPLALSIRAVELYDGRTKVAEDRHDGWAGNQHRNNVYTLTVRNRVKNPHLFITTDMERRDSWGRISIKKQ